MIDKLNQILYTAKHINPIDLAFGAFDLQKYDREYDMLIGDICDHPDLIEHDEICYRLIHNNSYWCIFRYKGFTFKIWTEQSPHHCAHMSVILIGEGSVIPDYNNNVGYKFGVRPSIYNIARFTDIVEHQVLSNPSKNETLINVVRKVCR